MNRAPLLRPESAQVLVKDLYYRVRREPNVVTNPERSREKPTVWVDFYHKKNWVQTSAGSSAMLTMLKFQTDLGHVMFLTFPS